MSLALKQKKKELQLELVVWINTRSKDESPKELTSGSVPRGTDNSTDSRPTRFLENEPSKR